MPSQKDNEAHRAREDLFESLAKSSMIGIYLVQDGKFVFGNPLFERCTGYRIDELFGVDCLALVILDDKPVVRENARKMLKGESASPYEYRFRAKNGELKWVLEMVTPVQYQGKRAALVNFVDITERKGVEEELRRHRLHLEELVEERSAELRQANAVLQQEIAERTRAQEAVQRLNAVLEQRVHERTQALQAKNTQLEDMLRQLQEMQQQVITQQKLASLGALTAGIAHEIRNPLNFVINFADLSTELIQELRDVCAQPAGSFAPPTWTNLEDILCALDQNVRKIIEHGKRADRIVTGMLQHSRGQPGARAPTDLNALLAENVNLAYHSMRAQDTSFQITIETAYDSSLGLAEVVPQDIGRAFLNIINNACYAVRTKHKELGEGFRPVLAVRTRNLGDAAEIRICDNGNGIPAGIRDQIFQPFFTTKPAGAGTGLGLSISYDIIVQEHRGQMTFDTAVGQFTEFVIALPKRAP